MPYKCAIASSVAKLLVGTKLRNNSAQSFTARTIIFISFFALKLHGHAQLN